MSQILSFLPYVLAYLFLSVCVALVLGKALRATNPIEEQPFAVGIETDDLCEDSEDLRIAA